MKIQKATRQEMKKWVGGVVAAIMLTVGVPVNAQSLDSIYFASNFPQKVKEELAQKSDSIFVVNVKRIEADNPNLIQYNVGTSILISEEEVITNYHVVQAFAEMNKDDQGTLRVASPAKLSEWIEAEIAFIDEERDIAILKLHRKVNYEPVTFAGASINQSVITIGYPTNPAGQLLLLDRVDKGGHTLWNTITKRIVYNSHTSVVGKDFVGSMQQDIAQGHSGGPVLDEKMNVVGMVTFVYEGMTYYLTSETLEDFIDQYRGTTTIKE